MQKVIGLTITMLMVLSWSSSSVAASQMSAQDEAAAIEYFTDMKLLNQDGEEVRFFSDVLKDQIVVINFIFTNCEGACPMMTQKLRMARAQLSEEQAARVRFVSISIDPKRDTPAAMKEFAKKNQANGNWVLLTGAQENIDMIVKKLGQYVADVEEHSTLMIAGDVNKRHWVKIPPMVPPTGIAEKLRLLVEES